ncbi:NAD(P)H nitroreductase [Glaciecola sp. XM2]|uniref:NAD(P)H nitroreductase n=1 Tax=Glaciecola sp. XM2 TaxID=1914931 RepID=UPI001BDE3C78|nr:NAD(P)H nitroreductase [Glaciecola sp. XM2]MBT1449377.1 NAD(P)H nitroreductase [Glaciecola sp. XM2]
MQALDLLLTRSSQPRLQAPAPEGEALQNILKSAMRAPDHRSLSPWRFIVCTGDGLQKLGAIFEEAAICNGADASVVDRASQLPLRAPMVIVAICNHIEHDGVPWVEQVASSACAVQAMQMAAVAQGFQGIWRTGTYARDESVKKAFNCKSEDEILGFLYLGTSPLKAMAKPAKSLDDYFEHWQ